MKLAGLNFHAFDLLNVDWIAIEKCVCCASLFSMRARERKRESKREEGEKCLEVEKMKENENTEMSETLFLFFSFLLFFMGRVGLNLGILFLG